MRRVAAGPLWPMPWGRMDGGGCLLRQSCLLEWCSCWLCMALEVRAPVVLAGAGHPAAIGGREICHLRPDRGLVAAGAATGSAACDMVVGESGSGWAYQNTSHFNWEAVVAK